MKFIFYLFFVFLVSCQNLSKKELDKKANYFLDISKGYLSKCLYPQALAETKKALELQPQSYIINDAIGVIYYLMKKYDTAQLYFLRAIRETPAYTQAKINLTQIFILKKKWRIALSYLKEAENDLTYRNPSKIHALIGEVYIALKKYFEAKKYLDTALQIDPNNCFALMQYGKMYYNQKNDRLSIYQFTKVHECIQKTKKFSLSCEKKIIDHYYYKAISELRTGKIKEAENSLKIYLFKAKGDKTNTYYHSVIKLLKQLQKK